MGVRIVGICTDAKRVGQKNLCIYEVRDVESGERFEVMTMNPIPGVRRGSDVDLPVRAQVRKEANGGLRDQVSYWLDDKSADNSKPIPGFDGDPEEDLLRRTDGSTVSRSTGEVRNSVAPPAAPVVAGQASK